MSATNILTQSGNRIVIKFDGQQIGALQSVRANDDYAPEPMSGIGDIHVYEWVPTMARHAVNVSNMVLKTGDLRTLGLAAENGDAVLTGIVFDIIEQDKDTGTVLRKYMGCSYASGDVEVTKHHIVIANGVFNCLDVSGTGM